MSQLYANENFPRPVVLELRRLGHDVLTVQETGKADQSFPDEAVLKLAADDGRAVLTINRLHFLRLHRREPDHAGIIIFTFDPDFPGQAARIDTAISTQGTLKGCLLRVNRPA